MGVKMIWPHDKTGLSLISPDLNHNKAARRKRGTERKEILTPERFLGALLNQSDPGEQGCWSHDWAAMERSVGGWTPVVAPGVKVIVSRL